LIFGLLGGSFGNVFLFANYLINKEYIAQNYCVNKAKPKLKCNGKCHLKKQLKEQEKKEESSKGSIKEINEIQLVSGGEPLTLKSPLVSIITSNIGYVQKPLFGLSQSFFHPPTC